ncbi:hypothetical protein H0H10_28240 [Streptomyces sp. TRM S81-3]|uniref:Uncharacterized protein n=1 Tax=Streptomyces griseicoloratus TaxID=2752516 RepID=A0A926L5N1_9ACTN|nr:hypothetical protein [Streptomyces griseicoloratus]MBD0422998.1 hypothetical protein [Streptomyces griseicoloratus]
MRLLRRTARRNVMQSLAMAVAGALLGAGVVAWQAGVPPFADDPCWDSVTDRELGDLFGDWDIKSAETEPTWTREASHGSGRLDGRCRVMAYGDDNRGGQVDIRVHGLEGRSGGGVLWSDEYLSSRLTPMGDGLLGMASDTRAWVVLPADCVKPDPFEGPAVVDVALGAGEIPASIDPDRRADHQQALARTAVNAANGAMARLGCTGSLPGPGELTMVPEARTAPGGRELCGLKGVRLPKALADSEIRTRATAGTGSPVRTCEVFPTYDVHALFRLQTVEKSELTGAFSAAVLDTGPSVESPDAPELSGSFSPALAAVRVECADDDVHVFLAQQYDSLALGNGGTARYTFVRDVFPAYVAAEAERLGCGPLRIRLPD